jgi:amidophosphoribosyltransferase
MGAHDPRGAGFIPLTHVHTPARAEGDHPQDECGVFGIFAPGEDVARLTYFGLFALQHRGQESAGIAVADDRELSWHKDMGLVSQVFDEESLSRLKGNAAIGHTRYSTTGSSVLCNAQPIIVHGASGPIAVAHNGNIVNTRELRDGLQARGARFESTNDSEVIARCIAHFDEGDVLQAIKTTMTWIQGAYSVVVLTPTALYAFRDAHGVRPLCLGALNGVGTVVSSETCALHVIGARFLREVEPGEVVVVDREGLCEAQAVPPERPAMCLFEFIYLARPDSHIYGRSLHEARRRMGHQLAAEHPVDAHIVIPVPDTGFPAAIGFAEASGIPFGEGLIKSRYIGRTFIEPDQRLREMGVRMKLSPLKENLAGRRVVMVDDSIVRGTTTGQIVRLLKEAGATQVHVRISSPPVRWPCFYGIDMANRRDLIAAKKSIAEIEQQIGADSLGYLSLPGVLDAVGVSRPNFCHACFSGEYPIPVPDELQVSKFQLEEPARELELVES